ncbi:MAG: 5'/3'-nucleotidase SurE [Elusimicrobia bacterium]|nr:5'/3'-nucleotidase SurE [Elusimicrobiota bacterium]
MAGKTILVCNDDGIGSPGLRAAAEAVAGLGDVVVVAPARQQTAAGRSLIGRPGARLAAVDFRAGRRRCKAYRIDASPAMLVQHAMAVLFARRLPDLVVAGVNYGENMGTTVTCSGTVGAALEAASFGVPALAVSLQTGVEHHMTYGDLDWAAARHFTGFFARRMLRRRSPRDVDVLNVNIPSSADASTPWRVTRTSRQAYFIFELRRPSVRARVGDGKVRVDVDLAGLEADSDIHALMRDRVVSVTPLSLDLTSRVATAAVAASIASSPRGASPTRRRS